MQQGISKESIARDQVKNYEKKKGTRLKIWKKNRRKLGKSMIKVACNQATKFARKLARKYTSDQKKQQRTR